MTTPAGPPNGNDDLEPALIASAAMGSHAAFEVIHARYRPRIHRFALARLSDPEDAEDVVQETFLEMYRVLRGYRGDASFWSWLAGIAYHRICSLYHRRRRARRDLLAARELTAMTRPGTWRAEAWLDAHRALGRCNELLEAEWPPQQRRIFHLRYAENQPIRAIASALGKNRAAVRVGLLRSREKLRCLLPELQESARPSTHRMRDAQ